MDRKGRCLDWFNLCTPHQQSDPRFHTMASWCTEPNQRAMISPIMRSELQGTLRGDVSTNHCMQSIYSKCQESWSMLGSSTTGFFAPSCWLRASSRASTTGPRCFIKILAARCPPVATLATNLSTVSIMDCKGFDNLRLHKMRRDPEHFSCKDDRLRKLQCSGCKLMVLR